MDKTSSFGNTREQAFQDLLLAAINEVRRHTKLGVATILEDVRRIGGLQAAKNRLQTRNHALHHQFLNRPSEYFLATKRIGRMDLSVEAIVLDPKWRGLFTQEETDKAAATLTDHGFSPTFEAPAASSTSVLVPTEYQFSFARIQLGERRGGFNLDEWRFSTGQYSGCEATAKLASELREGRRAGAQGLVRRHLGECPRCRDLYPELIAAFDHFDEAAETAWFGLLSIFQACMELGDEQLKRFHFLEPEDYEEPEHYEVDLETRLSEFIRPICAWRAVRVGCQLGRFMNAFAGTFGESGDLWLRWRKGELHGVVSSFVRRLDRQLFLLALLARNLLLVRCWPSEDEGVLWAPADEELVPVSNVLRLEMTGNIEEWEEVLGSPPRDLNLLGVLYLAHLAAIAELDEFESVPDQPGKARESREQMDRVEEMFRAIQDFHAEALQRQDAIVDELARILLYMESADRHACEQSVLAVLSDTYAKLTPEVRGLLLASEQMYRTPGFAAPGKIIDGLATAFEVQLQHSVMAGLFDYLRSRQVRNLRVLETWPDAEHRDKPLWRPDQKASKCELGQMRLILRHPQVEIEDFFRVFGLSRAAVKQATEVVYSRRNAAVHGNCLDIGTAEAVRSDWFSWSGRTGGVYSVLFRESEPPSS